MAYIPPDPAAVDFSWVGATAYTPPAPDAVEFSWAGGASQGISPAGFDSSSVGTPTAGDLPPVVVGDYAIIELGGTFAADVGIYVSTTAGAVVRSFTYSTVSGDLTLEGVAASLAGQTLTDYGMYAIDRRVYVWRTDGGPFTLVAQIDTEGRSVRTTITQVATPVRDGNRGVYHFQAWGQVRYPNTDPSHVGEDLVYWGSDTGPSGGGFPSSGRGHVKIRHYDGSAVPDVTIDVNLGVVGVFDPNNIGAALASAIATYNSGKAAKDQIGLRDRFYPANNIVPSGTIDTVDKGVERYATFSSRPNGSGAPFAEQDNYAFTFPAGGKATGFAAPDSWGVVWTFDDPGEPAYELSGGWLYTDRFALDSDPTAGTPVFVSRVTVAVPQITEVEVLGSRRRPGVVYNATIGSTVATYTSSGSESNNDVAVDLAADFTAAGFTVSSVSAAKFTVTGAAGVAQAVSGSAGPWSSPITVIAAVSVRTVRVGTGIYTGAVPTPHFMWDQTVLVGGIAPPANAVSNNHNIADRTKRLFPAGINQSGFGTTAVSHYLRYVDQQGFGRDSAVFGTPTITLGIRTLFPVGFTNTFWGTAVVGVARFVYPTGWLSDVFGTIEEVLVNQRRVKALGIAPPVNAFGDPDVRNRAVLVSPTGWLSQNIEFPVVFNKTRYLTVQPYADNIDPTEWPNYSPLVENAKRYLQTFGHQDSRVSNGTTIVNKADPLRATGWESLTFGTTRVEFVNRVVEPLGWDSYYSTQYAVVWNSARVIAPTGIASTLQIGVPDPVLNLNRTIKHHSGGDNSSYGTPFVAFGVRYLFPSVFNDVPNGIPEVRHNPYPITPVGIPPQQVGGHEVVEHFNIINPYSVNVHSTPWVGEPWVRNRNLTVGPYGYDQSEFGRTVVENFIKNIPIVGFRSDAVGAHLIERRTKNVNPAPIGPPSITSLHKIKNEIPDPPGSQLAEPRGFGPEIFGTVVFSIRGLWPVSLGLTERFGTAFVRTNVIAPRFIFEDGLFGVPFIAGPQYISVRSIDPTLVLGEPRLTPHHIYAPYGEEAPDSYHPAGTGGYVDQEPRGFDGSRWPIFGRTVVANKNRVLGPTSNANPGFPQLGIANVVLVRKIVSPQGIRSLRFGQIIFLNVPQYVDLSYEYDPQGIPSTLEFGTATVAFPPGPPVPPEAHPPGFVATLWGSTRIELFNREVLPQGIPHRGNPQEGNTTPWGTPLVGYPRTYSIGMGVQTLWGATNIDFKNRRVYPVGWINSSLENFSFENYRFPMKVTVRNPETRPVGIPSSTRWGGANVGHSVRTITGRGIDSYNGGDHSIKASLRVLCSGWDSSTFGNIDRWEAGKIKAYGADTSALGTPRVLNPVRPSSVVDGVVSSPRVAPSVRPSGIGPIMFVGPSVSNPFGCQTLVVTPLPILSAQAVPAPKVEHE